MDARRLSDKLLVDGARHLNLEEATVWTIWADKVGPRSDEPRRAVPLLPAEQDLTRVAQHQDLDLLGPTAPEDKHERRDHTANGKVGERLQLGAETSKLGYGKAASEPDPSWAGTR